MIEASIIDLNQIETQNLEVIVTVNREKLCFAFVEIVIFFIIIELAIINSWVQITNATHCTNALFSYLITSAKSLVIHIN